MTDVTVKRLDEFDVAFGGAMKLVRHGLGVESFGLQVIDMPPNADRYPEHDHAEDGQEEVYVVVRGGGTIRLDGSEEELRPGQFVFLSPDQKRQMVAGPDGLAWVGVGCQPGAYQPPGSG